MENSKCQCAICDEEFDSFLDVWFLEENEGDYGAGKAIMVCHTCFITFTE